MSSLRIHSAKNSTRNFSGFLPIEHLLSPSEICDRPRRLGYSLADGCGVVVVDCIGQIALLVIVRISETRALRDAIGPEIFADQASGLAIHLEARVVAAL